MRYFIDGSERYYFNDETLCVEFCTVTNKFKEREMYKHLSYPSYQVIFIEGNRSRKKQIPLSCLILHYISGYNFTEGDIIIHKDGDRMNCDVNNLEVSNIFSLCDKWVDLEESNMLDYKISSSGLLYNKKHYYIEDFSHIKGRYLRKSYYFLHHLVWKYFGDKELRGNYVIDHIDNNPLNNDISNLQMVSQNINIKKERKKNVFHGSIMITYNNKTYYLGKSKFYTSEECEEIYSNALHLCELGIIDEYFCEHDYISYDFLNLKWKIISFPNANDISLSGITTQRFNSFDDAVKVFNEVLEKYGLKYYPRKTKDFYLERNSICFGVNGKRYTFTLSKYDKSFSEKVIEFYLSHTPQEFLDMIPTFKKEIVERQNCVDKDVNKIKNINIVNLSSNTRSDYWIEFNNKANYSYSNKDDKYIFNIPYNGKYYYLGPIQYQEVVQEVDRLIIEKKNDENITFLQWLKEFSQNEFLKFQEKDMKIMVSQKRTESKGYYYFKARDCWKAHIKVNGVKLLLGYFKDERCAEYIYKEAVLTVERGVFDKWYLQIEKHKERIKWLFE